jgi:hypothetical protein
MTDRRPREQSRRIDEDLRWRWLIQTGARRTARLKAVPPAAWLGVEAAVFLGSGPCHDFGSVPVGARNRRFTWSCLARWASWPGSDAA